MKCVTFRKQLHSLRAVAQSPAPAVATGHHLTWPGEEARVELLEADLRDVDIVFPESLHNVRLRSARVIPETEIEVWVRAPGVSVQWRRHLVMGEYFAEEMRK